MISGICVFLPIQAFGNGVFDITAYVYYISLIALFIFVTVQTFEKRRWN
jgi:ABC-2 type transport system permease protein